MANQDYSWVTDAMFDKTLREICGEMDLLDVPGVYEIVREFLNNEVLERLEDERDE